MAVVFLEGFDTYNGLGAATTTSVGMAIRWTISDAGNFGLTSAITPYASGQAFRYSTGSLSKTAISSIPTISAGTIGFAFQLTSLPTGLFDVVTFFVGSAGAANRQFSIGFNTVAQLYVGTGTGTMSTAIYTTPDPVPLAAWNYLECEFTISNTVGTINFYINGGLFASATGLDTQTQATTAMNTVMLGTYSSSGFGSTVYMDDMYITDTATRLGEQRIITVVPASDSTPSQWTASNGAAAPYTMVDEALCNADTDYVYNGTLGDRAVFNMASTGATPLSVGAVQIGAYSRKTDTGTRGIQLQYVDSGGTAYNSAETLLSAGYTRQLYLTDTNPATATAWTPAEANSLKAGVRLST